MYERGGVYVQWGTFTSLANQVHKFGSVLRTGMQLVANTNFNVLIKENKKLSLMY